MRVQICEYCRSRVERGREDCKNCGAPVPHFHPNTNAYRHLSFIEVDDVSHVLQQRIANANMEMESDYWRSVLGRQGDYGNIQRGDCGNIVGRR